MTFSEAVFELARKFGKEGELDKFKELAKPELNLAYLDVGKSWNWPQLETYGSILAVPIVEGTVTITQGSQTVTITGANSAWKGRFFRKDGGENSYRIMNITGDVLTLDNPIIEDAGSITYEIEKRFYTLPTEVREVVAFDADSDRVMSSDNRGLRSRMPNYWPPLLDVPFIVAGTDKFTDVYETGTATSSQDSDVITGDGTAWMANVRPGNIFRFSNVDYRVRRVETNTKLVLYNFVGSAITDSYKIYQDQALTVRLRGTFSTKKVIPFNYIRTVYPLIHDDDRFDLSEEATIAVLSSAEAKLSKTLGRDDWANIVLLAQGQLRTAQELAKPVKAAFTQLQPLVARGMGRG